MHLKFWFRRYSRYITEYAPSWGFTFRRLEVPRLLLTGGGLVTESCLTLRPHGLEPTSLLCSWDFQARILGVGCHFLLQGIFLTQGSTPRFLCLLSCRQILYPLSHQGSPASSRLSKTGREAHIWMHTMHIFVSFFRGESWLGITRKWDELNVEHIVGLPGIPRRCR